MVVFVDKIYDEAAAYQQAKDEAKQVRAVENRNAKVRQLFRQQSKANRAKVNPLLLHILSIYCHISRMNNGFLLLNFSLNLFTLINSRMKSIRNNRKMMIMIDN